MNHVQAENICDARALKREFLRIGNRVQPRAPDQIRRNNIRRELFEETRARANFHGEATGLSKRNEAREKFLIINSPQNGFLVPNTAVPLKLLLSLCIYGHCAFFNCTEFG